MESKLVLSIQAQVLKKNLGLPGNPVSQSTVGVTVFSQGKVLKVLHEIPGRQSLDSAAGLHIEDEESSWNTEPIPVSYFCRLNSDKQGEETW